MARTATRLDEDLAGVRRLAAHGRVNHPCYERFMLDGTASVVDGAQIDTKFEIQTYVAKTAASVQRGGKS